MTDRADRDNEWAQRQRERKMSALIAVILQLDPRPTPDDVNVFTAGRWQTLAKIAGIKAPSAETVRQTRERYGRVWLARAGRQP